MMRRHEMNMCEGPILGKMLLFALPLMASSVLQLMFNAADVIVVGKFAGDNSLAAVGSNSSLINLLTSLFLGLSVGVNVLTARFYGSHDTGRIEETVHTSMALSVLIGVFLTILGITAASPILTAMQVPQQIRPLSEVYLRIYFIGTVSNVIYNFGAAILRAVGDTRRPLYYLTIAGIINVILNLIFVILLHMDVAGVAIATVISQTISAVLVIRCLMKEEGAIRLIPGQLRLKKQIVLKILQIGLPASLQSMLFSISNVIIQSSINSFGAVTVAANSAASNLEGFVYVGMNAFYQASLTFTGQNMGAGRVDRVNRVLACAMGCVIVTGLILGVGCAAGAGTLLKLYTSSPEVIRQARIRLWILAGPYFLCGMMDVAVGALRGLGYSIVPMFVSLFGVCGLRLIWIATGFQLPRFHKLQYLIAAYPVSWTLTFSVHMLCFWLIRRRIDGKGTRFGHLRYHKKLIDK